MIRSDAERACLGAYFLNPELVTREPVPERLLSSDGRQVWDAIRKAHGDGAVDVLAVKHHLMRNGNAYERIGDEGLALMLDGSIRSKSIKAYLRQLEREQHEREIADASRVVAKALEAKDTAAIREAAAMLSDLARSGPEVVDELLGIDLHEATTGQVQPIPWTIPGWIADGDLVLLAGEPATGKSVFSMSLALAISSGTSFLGHFEAGPAESVLYLDEENNPRLASRRLGMLLRHDAAPHPDDCQLTYRVQNQLNLDSDDCLARIRAEIEAVGPRWVFFDSLVRFHRRDENSNAAMADFFAGRLRPLAADYGCGIVILHHLAKPSKERSEIRHRIRGASDILAVVDQALALEGDTQTRRRTLQHDKCRWADTSDPLTLEWAETDGTAILTATSETLGASELIERRVHEAGPVGVVRKELVDSLKAAGFSAAEKAATRALGRLHGMDQVKRRREGKNTRYWAEIFAPSDAE